MRRGVSRPEHENLAALLGAVRAVQLARLDVKRRAGQVLLALVDKITFHHARPAPEPYQGPQPASRPRSYRILARNFKGRTPWDGSTAIFCCLGRETNREPESRHLYGRMLNLGMPYCSGVWIANTLKIPHPALEVPQRKFATLIGHCQSMAGVTVACDPLLT